MKYPIGEEHIKIQTNTIFEFFCSSVPEMTTDKSFVSQQINGFL